MNILFAASEAFPFIKTGGLGDVIHSLPNALNKLGDEVRLVLPAYRDVLASVDSIKELGTIDVPGAGVRHRVRILQAHENELGDYLYLIDVPNLFDRPGNPYVHSDGYDWPDNAERYTVFSRIVALLAKWIPKTSWRPEVVHCHDWQTGLVPAFLSMVHNAPVTVFTIHNLAYDGYFSHDEFNRLGLPPHWWSPDYVEFYGGFSMLKAGMFFSDHVTTVSPTYAKEICTPEFGNRFDGVLRHLGDKLTGILNGVDLDVWNPLTDAYIVRNYTCDDTFDEAKSVNKQDLLDRAGLSNKDAPLLGFVGRLVEQKGVDLITAVLPQLFTDTNANFVLLGSGHMAYEQELLEIAARFPGRLCVHIGYSEELAHKIEAGADMFIMPSRFEPCGLNQMYSLRYGTPPVVNNTGGLADTVVNVTLQTLREKSATGFIIDEATSEALYAMILSAMDLYKNKKLWHEVCLTAMQQDWGWENSANQYHKLYRAEVGARK
ncbi:MAG: glycogen synthase GlgA [Gammaproteobacteria bacterium]